jgi:NAD(P)-dependent dehydrogenase (short-subunit alcohol dehydrogenase family)
LFATLPKRRIEEIPSDEFDRVMQVNVRGAFECARAVAPIMKRQGYGKIVNITSGTVFKGQVMMLSYVTSKGAIVAMTRCLARELGPDGIRANALAPGFTMSEGVKEQSDWVEAGKATVASRCLRRDQVPEDLNGALTFLLAPASDFMTGQTVVVDGGSVMH